MTQNQQRRRFEEAQGKGERALLRELAQWTSTTIEEWIPGTATAPRMVEDTLRVILNRVYNEIAANMLSVRWQLFKQEDDPTTYDEAMIAVATALAPLIESRREEATTAIISTLETFMERSNQAAAEAGALTVTARARVARQDLARRMRRHRLIIAVTESGTVAGTAHQTAVLAVQDPLKNTVERVYALLQAGQFNEARRLSEGVMKLARLPLSVKQGQLIDTIGDVRDRLVTPLSQARILTQLGERMRELDVRTKTWHSMEDAKVRPSHAAVNGTTVPMEQPFVLAGGLMLKPRDGSLGASLSEIVNCRCEVSYD
mgnify:CR=1 FL=1